MRYFILLTYIIVVSCNVKPDSFYKTSHTEDIDVLPLIKPYRLWTPIPNKSTWALDFKKAVSLGTNLQISQMQVCNINVNKGIIYGHCAAEGRAPNCSYFVVIPDSSIEKIFKSKQDWYTYLKERSTNGDDLYDVNEVYNKFNEKGYEKLPWYKEINDSGN